MKEYSAEILICGGGIIGLTLARELSRRGFRDIILIEKEDEPGRHASGRNSGVLHAGIYYTPESMKARCCLAGNRMMKEYCREKNLPLLESGKVIVAQNESELDILHSLYLRARTNGADVKLIDEKELSQIEPSASTAGKALWSPETTTIDPKLIMKSLYDELKNTPGITILSGSRFTGLKTSDTVRTTKGEIRFGMFINAAGAFSDKVAHAFDVGRQYTLIPFRGTYFTLKPAAGLNIRGNIYPVPDPRNPFLGVHFTRGISGNVYVGPTAIPALGRENYGLLEGIRPESVKFLTQDLVLFLVNRGFRNLALTEPQKYLRHFIHRDAKKLVKQLDVDNLCASDKTGIRPQLVDWDKKELVMDFLVVKDGSSVHILNSISPAFTSSMNFARILADSYL